MTNILQKGYYRLLALSCALAYGLTYIALGHACRTILYEPKMPESIVRADN